MELSAKRHTMTMHLLNNNCISIDKEKLDIKKDWEKNEEEQCKEYCNLQWKEYHHTQITQ